MFVCVNEYMNAFKVKHNNSMHDEQYGKGSVGVGHGV